MRPTCGRFATAAAVSLVHFANQANVGPVSGCWDVTRRESTATATAATYVWSERAPALNNPNFLLLTNVN